MSSKTDVEEFLEGPLVTWIKSCLHDPEKLTEFEDLADGLLIYEVLLLIDPEPLHHGVCPSLGNEAVRTKNMECIIKNIKSLYEEELCQLIIVLPDPIKLGKEPESKLGLEQMQLLLMLLLGCAVQCPNKQVFIERIKELHLEAQHCLVDFIRQVTESQQYVLTPEGCENVSNQLLLEHIRRLLKQRDIYIQTLSDDKNKGKNSSLVSGSESQHLAVELADWKSKLRKQRQELEEKSEALAEVKDELVYNKSVVSKLKNEINELKTEARVGKAYRDEADALREKAERAERLEAEVCKYRDKLSDLEYYRSRVEELRQDKRVLEDTREMLEDQLSRARSRVEYTIELENKVMDLKQTINDLSLEKDSTQEKISQLFEENAQLALLSKSLGNVTSEEVEENISTVGNNSLCEQLSSNAQGRALKLELENRRLAQTLESLQEATLQQTNDRLLQLEKDKKKLSLQVEELEENKKKLISNINELEDTVKLAQRDTSKMQDIQNTLQSQLQLRIEEIDTVHREKNRLELRLQEAEENLEKLKAKEIQAEESAELRAKISALEKEIARLKEALETKAVSVDRLQCELDNNLKEKTQLTRQLDESNIQINRLTEIEKSFKDLKSNFEVNKATLEVLQNDLVAERMITRQLKDTLEHPEHKEGYLERIMADPEILRALKEKLSQSGSEQSLAHSNPIDCELQEENAKLSVLVSTLQSQVQSLNAQHTAQKLANSQLVAEKDTILKNLESLEDQYQQVCVDQLRFQKIHEQLGCEYEKLSKDRETAKAETMTAKVEARTLLEIKEKLEAQSLALEQELTKIKKDSIALVGLRMEHTKLKDDFRNLFTAHDKLKTEYRAAHDDYKSMKNEVRTLTLKMTELEGIAATSNEQLQTEQNLNRRLRQATLALEEDKKSLMEHVTILLSQYHSLLTHSLEDKEHYHHEEKHFRDQVNFLTRQKEKLEEKIMEHYRKMESCPTKKKGFGANLVRKVKKAGSELMNKSRRSWHEDSFKQNQGGNSGTLASDSDTSLEEVRTRQDSLGGAGTRRTLYLSGDENNPTNDDDKSFTTLPDVPRTSTPQQDPSVLVYNRVTAVIGGNETPKSHSPSVCSSAASRKSHVSRAQDKWFEYGSI